MAADPNLTRPDPKGLDITVKQGARAREYRYAEWHRRNGQQLRGKHRTPATFKGTPAKTDGNNPSNNPAVRKGVKGKFGVSWRQGTGTTKRSARG